MIFLWWLRVNCKCCRPAALLISAGDRELRHTYMCMYVCDLGRVYIKDHWRPYEMIFDDYDGQWYPGWLWPKFSRHLSSSRGKTTENHNQDNWPDRALNPGTLDERQRASYVRHPVLPILLVPRIILFYRDIHSRVHDRLVSEGNITSQFFFDVSFFILDFTFKMVVHFLFEPFNSSAIL